MAKRTGTPQCMQWACPRDWWHDVEPDVVANISKKEHRSKQTLPSCSDYPHHTWASRKSMCTIPMAARSHTMQVPERSTIFFWSNSKEYSHGQGFYYPQVCNIPMIRRWDCRPWRVMTTRTSDHSRNLGPHKPRQRPLVIVSDSGSRDYLCGMDLAVIGIGHVIYLEHVVT